eukprot:CAMPEP_0178753910 /NCGR_PEP_ID=MMETSP0744-20121128/11870_1 /TAXON_ID=913974 /ORGANISM="Nitzschia punctata, Strain CCMP561" /LENGTH=171 /DNA_ID=CAMNT_0020407771 /DNA_START=120 /DNA_END=638 /DNA_ORIENTATION=-
MSVVVVMNHASIGFAPRALEPTEFMAGLCLGICIGGVILSFFLSVQSRRAYKFCKYAEEYYEEEDHQHACGNLTSRLWNIWWWSTLTFWFDLAIALLIASGRHELSYSEQQQYQSIGGEPPEHYGSGPSFQQQAPPSFQQTPQMQQQQQQQQQQTPLNSGATNSRADIMSV